MMTDEINNSSVPVCQALSEGAQTALPLFVPHVVVPVIMAMHALRIVAALIAGYARRPRAAGRLSEAVAGGWRVRPVIRHALRKAHRGRRDEHREGRKKCSRCHGSISSIRFIREPAGDLLVRLPHTARGFAPDAN